MKALHPGNAASIPQFSSDSESILSKSRLIGMELGVRYSEDGTSEPPPGKDRMVK